ncbi:hypothetical protein KSMBR1_3197 [Candidatus Kuenenia stuttgartiensis]|uniref:Uncharacterized protein n=1 Tax=Kuenenia stuttgartiensis TaxID=174633 RepID=A0A2C9CIT2_KUEST|nr:hypothetical protein [Candidatus Kuenenia stuttgartiensis]SOH05674.1 hypothetical protein KSMBR1_3197 [Candidatus Kuenenia stuttgartiensis]
MRPLVLTEVEYLKGAEVLAIFFKLTLNANHALAGGMDSKLA